MSEQLANKNMETTEQISAEELQAFRAYKAAKEAAARRQTLRKEYTELVDSEIEGAYQVLSLLSEEMAEAKKAVFDNFRAVIEMKTEQLGLGKGDDQYTHTFTNSASSLRITLGNYTIDTYRDTVEEGIRMVTDYIESLAKDEDSSSLVSAVLRLLSRNKAGQIQAGRVLQLRKLAEESGDESFLDGVKLIEDSYNPQVSKSFVKIEQKNSETGEWISVPLSLSGV